MLFASDVKCCLHPFYIMVDKNPSIQLTPQRYLGSNSNIIYPHGTPQCDTAKRIRGIYSYINILFIYLIE